MRRLRLLGIALLVALIGLGLWMALVPEPRVGMQPADSDDVALGIGGAEEPPAKQRAAAGSRRRLRPEAPGGTVTVEADPEEAGEVRGQVLVERGGDTLPVEAATIEVVRDGVDDGWDGLRLHVVGPQETVSSDAEGWFRFAIGPDERWQVRVRTRDGLWGHEVGEGPTEFEAWVGEPERAVLVVVDEHDQPLPGATAYLYVSSDEGPPHALAAADADGRIVLDPSPGDAAVTAPGHGFAHVSAPEGEERVVLGPGFDVAGRVVDETGAPYARIRMYTDDDGFTREIVTGEDGAFRFERLAPEEMAWVTLVLHDGSEVHRTIPFGEQDALLEITRGGDIVGVVLMPDGTPAPLARVEGADVVNGRFQLWSDDDEDAFWLNAHVTGSVEGFGAPVRTHAAGQRVELQPGRTVDVRLVLEELPRSFVALRLVDEEGRRLAVRRVHHRARGAQQQSVGDRLLLFLNEPPGTEIGMRLQPQDPAYASATTTVITSATWRSTPVDVRATRPEPTRIRLFAPGGDEIPYSEWTSFRVTGHGAAVTTDGPHVIGPSGGGAKVRLEARGRRLDRLVVLQQEPPYELHLQLPVLARVTGRLVRSDDRPASGLGVVVVPHSEMATGRYVRGISKPDGSFAIADVPSGRAWLYVWNEGEEVLAHAMQIEVPTDGDLALGRLFAWSPVVARGRVSVPDGDAAGGIRVEVLWDGGRHDETTTTAADGSFELQVPGTDDALIVATRAGKLRGVRRIDLSRDTRADIRLLRSGRIRLLTTRAWRNAGLDVWLVSPDRALRWDPTTTWPGNSEHVFVDDVPAGSWIVEIQRDDEVTEIPVSVPAGGTVDVQVAR